MERDYFFCGVGGSGMAPLALIVQARGARVAGSDRGFDQGRNLGKAEFLRGLGVTLHPQDGSGVTRADQTLVISGAVEESVPDVQAARRAGAKIVKRPELLAGLFNSAALSIGVAGTSGKSTITGMIASILHAHGRDPTVMNGAEMRSFITPEAPFASALVGAGEVFLSEVDESDGSIALYRPTVAVVSNVSLDHKSMEELRGLFSGFVGHAGTAVLNLDNEETAALALARRRGGGDLITYGLNDPTADLTAADIRQTPGGAEFRVIDSRSGDEAQVALQAPGRHNISNALAALGAALACGVSLGEAAAGLAEFAGIRRRLEVSGTAGGVTVIDDFAHNPDKITATLQTLHAFPGRLLCMFQPHGFGPLKLMRDALIETFAEQLAAEDVLLIPQPVYYGGTADRSVTSSDIAEDVARHGRHAEALETRADCGDRLLQLAHRGDRIVIMGARDDTLSAFAAELVERLARTAD